MLLVPGYGTAGRKPGSAWLEVPPRRSRVALAVFICAASSAVGRGPSASGELSACLTLRSVGSCCENDGVAPIIGHRVSAQVLCV